MFFSITGLITVILFGLFVYLLVIKESEIIDGVVFSTGLGLGIVGILLFIENTYFKIPFGFSNALIVTIVFLLADILLILKKWSVLSKFKNTVISGIKTSHFKFNGMEVIILSLISLISLIIFYKVVLLPINTGDALASWANFPKNIFNQGIIPVETGSSLKNMNAYPNLFAIQVSWLYFLNGRVNDLWMRILSFLYLMLAVLIMYKLGYEYLKKRELALFAVFILFINTIFINSSIRMNIQQPVFFYSIAFYYFLEKFYGTKNINYLLVSGILGGLAGFVKYNAMPFVLAVCCFFLLTLLANKQLYENSRYFIKDISKKKMMIYFLSPIVLLTGLWMVRNLYYYHDPVYPYITGGERAVISSLGSRQGISLTGILIKQGMVLVYFNFIVMFLFVISFMQNVRANFFRPEFLCIFLTYIFFMPIITTYHSVGACARYLSVVLPLISISAVKPVVSIFENPDNKTARYLTAGIALMLLVYTVSVFIGEGKGLSIPSLAWTAPFVTLLVMSAYTKATDKQENIGTINRGYKALVSAVIFILIVPSLVFALQAKYDQTVNRFPYIKSEYPSRKEVIDYRLGKGAFEFREWVNENVDKDARIMGFIGHTYYFDNEFIMPDDKELQDIYMTGDLSEALLILKGLNIQYIIDATNVLSDTRYRKYLDRTIISQNLSDENYFKLMYNKNNYRLYYIRY